MPSQKPIRDLIVIDAVASETTINSFLDTADALEGRVLKADGSASPTGEESFKIVAKRKDGNLKVSEVVNTKKVTRLTKTEPKTDVNRSYSIEIPSGITAGELLRISIVLSNWGSLSMDNEYFKYGNYKVFSTDSIEDIANGLLTSLSNNFEKEQPKTFKRVSVKKYNAVSFSSKAAAVSGKSSLTDGELLEITGTGAGVYRVVDKTASTFDAIVSGMIGTQGTLMLPTNPLFTFTKTGSGDSCRIVITEVPQPQVVGKKPGRHLEFYVTSSFTENITFTNRVINPCGGKTLKELEWFCAGNTGDIYREMGFPYNLPPMELGIEESASYYVINLGYYNGDGRSNAVSKSPRDVQIAIKDKAAANTILQQITTATGITVSNFA